MSRTTERTLWALLALALGLALGAAALWGWPWESARHSAEWERGRALLFDQHTTYDSPVIPETPEEAARRAKGMDDVEFEELYYGSLIIPQHNLLNLNYSRVANYIAARELLDEDSDLEIHFVGDAIDRRRLGFTYLAQSVRDGYPPARILYDQEAEKELARALTFFEDGDKQHGLITLSTLAMEDYPPAVEMMLQHYEKGCGRNAWVQMAARNGSGPGMYSLTPDMHSSWGQPATPRTYLAYAWELMTLKQFPGRYSDRDLSSEYGLSETEMSDIKAFVAEAEPTDLPLTLFRDFPPIPIYLNYQDATRAKQAAPYCYINDQSKDPDWKLINSLKQKIREPE